MIKFIRNVPYEFSIDLKPDFECSTDTGVLFLSMRYHKLHPAYIETRISDLSKYNLKVLLLLLDVEEPSFLLRDLNMFCYRAGVSLVLCYTSEEVAEYIENFKLCEKKNPELIIMANQKRKDKLQQIAKTKNEELFDNVVDFLSSIRTISQSDAKILICNFGSIKAIASASMENLTSCIGLGPKKAENVYNFFRSEFISEK